MLQILRCGEKRSCDCKSVCREEVLRAAASLHVKVTEVGRRRERQLRLWRGYLIDIRTRNKYNFVPASDHILYCTYSFFFGFVSIFRWRNTLVATQWETRKTAYMYMYLKNSCDSLYHDTIHE
jgi:hypothetical protein